MLTSLLPTFKVFEVGSLAGLRAGHMMSQIPTNPDAIATVTVGNKKYVENGIIVGLGANGMVENYDPTKHEQPFVHFDEELTTILNEKRLFAVPVEDVTRDIALYVGDFFVTDNYAGETEGAKYAKVVGGVLTLQTAADENTMFIAKADYLADGTPAYEFCYYRKA